MAVNSGKNYTHRQSVKSFAEIQALVDHLDEQPHSEGQAIWSADHSRENAFSSRQSKETIMNNPQNSAQTTGNSHDATEARQSMRQNAEYAVEEARKAVLLATTATSKIDEALKLTTEQQAANLKLREELDTKIKSASETLETAQEDIRVLRDETLRAPKTRMQKAYYWMQQIGSVAGLGVGAGVVGVAAAAKIREYREGRGTGEMPPMGM